MPGFLVLLFILIGLIYFLAIQLVVNVCRNKGRDPIPFVILSFFASPLVVLVVLLILPPEDGGGPWRGAGT